MRTYGAGLYVLDGTNSIYVYTNRVSLDSLLRMAREASSLLTVKNRERDLHLRFPERGAGSVFPVLERPKRQYEANIKLLHEISLGCLCEGVPKTPATD